MESDYPECYIQYIYVIMAFFMLINVAGECYIFPSPRVCVGIISPNPPCAPWRLNMSQGGKGEVGLEPRKQAKEKKEDLQKGVGGM